MAGKTGADLSRDQHTRHKRRHYGDNPPRSNVAMQKKEHDQPKHGNTDRLSRLLKSTRRRGLKPRPPVNCTPYTTRRGLRHKSCTSTRPPRAELRCNVGRTTSDGISSNNEIYRYVLTANVSSHTCDKETLLQPSRICNTSCFQQVAVAHKKYTHRTWNGIVWNRKPIVTSARCRRRHNDHMISYFVYRNMRGSTLNFARQHRHTWYTTALTAAQDTPDNDQHPGQR